MGLQVGLALGELLGQARFPGLVLPAQLLLGAQQPGLLLAFRYLRDLLELLRLLAQRGEFAVLVRYLQLAAFDGGGDKSHSQRRP